MHEIALLQKNVGYNPLLGTGMLVALIGVGWGWMRHYFNWLWQRMQSLFVVEIEVLNSDTLYEDLQRGLALIPKSHRFRLLSATTLNANMLLTVISDTSYRASATGPPIVFSLAPGSHFLSYEGIRVWIQRVRDTGPQSMGTAYREKMSLKFPLCNPERARSIIRSLAEDGRRDVAGQVRIYTLNGCWSLDYRKPIRPLSSVILPQGQLEDLIADSENFFSSQKWYNDLGLPFRRGYLFHGLPGSGKSSTIMALASHLKCPIYIIHLSDEQLSDQTLQSSLAQIPEHSILVLEDVDAVSNYRASLYPRESTPFENLSSRISLSGLLNSLDGLVSSEGRLLLMTTNHKERLDPALIRPGRVDIQVEFGFASRDQAERLFQRFFPSANSVEVEQFAAAASRTPHTMADLQKHLLIHRSDMKRALDPKCTPMASCCLEKEA